jgi:hypothetical protein
VHEPFLTGSVKLKLDENSPTGIDVPVLLSFKETQNGSAVDEFSSSINFAPSGTATVTLTSASVFDLFVNRVALRGAGHKIDEDIGQAVPGGGSISVSFPVRFDPVVPVTWKTMVDCELAIRDDPVPVSQLLKFLELRTVDVQDTQHLLAVNAGAVNFDARAIERIEVMISLNNLPAISIPPLLLLKERAADSTHALVPIVQAITELDGTLLFTVHFLDPNRVPLSFTRQNDFVQNPIFILNDGDIAT